MSKNNLLLEDEVEDLIELDAAQTYNSQLWRNNSGAQTIFEENGSKRHLRFGLGNISKAWNEKFASSDRIGGTPILITPDMVGQVVLVLTSIEVKREGWTFTGKGSEPQQKEWIDLIKQRCGIAGFASSVDEYRKIVNDYISRLRNRTN